MPGPYAQDKSVLGFGREVTAGTPVTVTDLVPVNALQTFRNIRQLDDIGWRGSMAALYGQVQGPWSTEIDFGGDVFPDLIGWAYKGLLGDETVGAAVSGVYPHTIALLNSGQGQPPTTTFLDLYGPVARQFPFGVIGSLDIKYAADGKITYAAKAMGRADSVVSLPVLSYTTLPPLASWPTVVTMFGVAMVALSGDVNFRRATSPIFAMGAQDANVVWGGAVNVSGKLVCLLMDDTPITNYIGNTQGVLTLDSSIGSGATAVQHKITMSKAAMKVTKPSRALDAMRVEIDFDAVSNLTDAGASGGFSPASVLLRNARATAY